MDIYIYIYHILSYLNLVVHTNKGETFHMWANTADFAQTLTHLSPQLNWMSERESEREKSENKLSTELPKFSVDNSMPNRSKGQNVKYSTLQYTDIIAFHLGNGQNVAQ